MKKKAAANPTFRCMICNRLFRRGAMIEVRKGPSKGVVGRISEYSNTPPRTITPSPTIRNIQIVDT